MRHIASCDKTKRDCVNIFWPWSKQRWQTTCYFWHTRPLWQTNPYHGVKVMYYQPPPPPFNRKFSKVNYTSFVALTFVHSYFSLCIDSSTFFFLISWGVGTVIDEGWQAIFPKCEHNRSTWGADVRDCTQTQQKHKWKSPPNEYLGHSLP